MDSIGIAPTTTINGSSTSAIIRPTSNFTWVAITYLSDTLFLLFLLSGPLLKFSKSRFAVFLIYSKCIASALDLPVSVVNQKVSLRIVQQPLTIVVRFHVLALALNRAHSVLFPFHYSKISSRRILHFCLLTWAISLGIGYGSVGIGMIEGDAKFQLLGTMRNYCNLFVAALAASIYVLMSAKLWCTKYLSNGSSSVASNAVEKDQMRIFLVCLISVIPFLLAYLSRYSLPINSPPDWLQSAVNILGAIFDSLSFVAEEICLVLISPDFRRLIFAHLRQIVSSIFCGILTIPTPKNASSRNAITVTMQNNNIRQVQLSTIEGRRSILTIEPMPSFGIPINSAAL